MASKFFTQDGAGHLREIAKDSFEDGETKVEGNKEMGMADMDHSVLNRIHSCHVGFSPHFLCFPREGLCLQAELTYVNLQLNPERYTGYTGPSAHRIWESIYKDNCLEGVPGDASTERHVLYKLLSGLHSSISVHIAAEYLLDEAKDQWGPNPSLLYERVLKYPERVTNLYFTFLFVLRSVTKADNFSGTDEYKALEVCLHQVQQQLQAAVGGKPE